MAGIKSSLAKALMLYLVLLPWLGMPAGAQRVPPPTTDPPPGFDPPRPVDPPRPDGPGKPPAAGEIVFTPSAAPVTMHAFNGFRSDATAGQFRHSGHGHAGGRVTVDSPWGEQLKLRYWLTPHGVTFEYDDDLVVRYFFDAEGTLAEIVAETADRQARMPVGRRAELAYLGQADPETFDMSAYVLIDEALRAKHSTAFLAGLRDFDGPAQASCTTQAIQCVACILAWAVSVGAIATACIVGGVPTFGTACLLAILAHEATNFTCAATCVEWMEDCFGGPPDGGDSIPDGCEPR